MDVLMPEMDGNVALRQNRQAEEAEGIGWNPRVKIVMITGIESARSISSSFGNLCNAKPVGTRRLLGQLESFGLLSIDGDSKARVWRQEDSTPLIQTTD
jgi:CheY-like chemotaxis protein